MTIKEKVSQGIPLTDEIIVDCHSHMGPWQNFYIPKNSAKDMVGLMDRVGFKCCFPAAHAGIGPDFKWGNDMILQAMADFPGRFHGYCCVNPNYSEKEMVEEMERCCVKGPMRAIKFHPDCHRYPANGKGYRAAWEFANEHKMIILSHTEMTSPYDGTLQFDEMATKFPEVRVILGHAGFRYEGYALSTEVIKRHEHVYMDLCGSTMHYWILERSVAAIGSEKILFGTDLPFIDLRPSLGRVAFSRISEQDKKNILGLNMARIAGLKF